MNSLNLNLKSFLKIFLVSSVPLVAWSSCRPNNLKPSIKTFTILCIGLFIFGLGESILVVSQYGVTPWTVLAEGFAKKNKYWYWSIYFYRKRYCIISLVAS
jgi:hypothetical protein